MFNYLELLKEKIQAEGYVPFEIKEFGAVSFDRHPQYEGWNQEIAKGLVWDTRLEVLDRAQMLYHYADFAKALYAAPNGDLLVLGKGQYVVWIKVNDLLNSVIAPMTPELKQAIAQSHVEWLQNQKIYQLSISPLSDTSDLDGLIEQAKAKIN